MVSEGERNQALSWKPSEGHVSRRREWAAVLDVADGVGKMSTED